MACLLGIQNEIQAVCPLSPSIKFDVGHWEVHAVKTIPHQVWTSKGSSQENVLDQEKSNFEPVTLTSSLHTNVLLYLNLWRPEVDLNFIA